MGMEWNGKPGGRKPSGVGLDAWPKLPNAEIAKEAGNPRIYEYCLFLH